MLVQAQQAQQILDRLLGHLQEHVQETLTPQVHPVLMRAQAVPSRALKVKMPLLTAPRMSKALHLGRAEAQRHHHHLLR